MLLSNIALEMTFKCLDHRFCEKEGKESLQLVGFQITSSFPMFPEHCTILTPLCQPQAGRVAAAQSVTTSTFKPFS